MYVERFYPFQSSLIELYAALCRWRVGLEMG
jgi:hypothetical protein